MIIVNLIIDADLTNPPTEISVFRDVTLYSKIFLDYTILLECDNRHRDIYYYWLKSKGAFDYVDDFINFGDEYGVTIRHEYGTICVEYLSSSKLNEIISLLKQKILYL